MKRIIILAGAITLLAGTTLFAKNMDNTGVGQNQRNYVAYSQHHTGHGRHYNSCCDFDGVRRNNINSKEIEMNRIAIAEKRVELRKEMLKDSPDWNKVEKLNQEIASKRASNHTMMMRERALNQNNQ
ncbi:hypothetical protein [uncultured Fusobacterium sp.]|uniref:hypothetical protein n=1 Tax=uncultured Fusobacterium sp. TaxID=159267 RepID=UPI0025EC0207|nr:hypothetical protein [uncultured Fusobacterium sp.]